MLWQMSSPPHCPDSSRKRRGHAYSATQACKRPTTVGLAHCFWIRPCPLCIAGGVGLSIEQRKRLSIGVELVANPSVRLLSKPLKYISITRSSEVNWFAFGAFGVV